jgi:hypothetical protein
MTILSETFEISVYANIRAYTVFAKTIFEILQVIATFFKGSKNLIKNESRKLQNVKSLNI